MNADLRHMRRLRGAPFPISQSHAQRGVVLVVALIVLVAMTLASIAMVRSVDTSTLIAGNLAFKKSGIVSGDAGVEAAIAWLTANKGTTLEADSPSNGYYATSQDNLDLTGNKTPDNKDDNLDWSSADQVVSLAKDKAGNTVSYVIHRMCDNPGPLDGATCATEQRKPEGEGAGAARQMMSYGPGGLGVVANVGNYRITVRIAGPRNTVTYMQTIVALL